MSLVQQPPDVFEELPFETAMATIVCPVQLPLVNDLKRQYGSLTIDGLGDHAGLTAVDEARKHVKRVRLDVERWRKDQNEEALKHQRTVNTAAKLIREPLEELEEQLGNKVKAISDEVARLRREADERVRAEKEAKLKSRLSALQEVQAYLTQTEVEALSDDDFADLISQKKLDLQSKQEAERAVAQQQAVERERLQVEAEQLADERRKLDAERAEQDRLRREAEEQAAAAQRKRHEEERLAIEQKALAERQQAAQLRNERLRPDREKLVAFAQTVENLKLPELADEDGLLLQGVVVALQRAATTIRQLAIPTEEVAL